MRNKKHILVLDAIAFAGGSKVATDNLLNSFDQQDIRVTVVTNDKKSWSGGEYNFSTLWQCPGLTVCEHGLAYFLRHLILALSIIIARIRFGKIDLAIGASGPGVDLSLYITKRVLFFPIMQLIHGPVGCSGIIARCLLQAESIYYLASTLCSIKQTLLRRINIEQAQRLITSDRYQVLCNGLPEQDWPSRCQYKFPQILWAASLLKWKGLEQFIGAIKQLPVTSRPLTQICYLPPSNIAQPCSTAPIDIEHVHWHQQPQNLDQIRSSCNIFVSTSVAEPFGLSILEAMAAGHCIIIPADNAYWDQILDHQVNCLKYPPGDVKALAIILQQLNDDISLVERIGCLAFTLAQQYKAEQLYVDVRKTILSLAQGVQSNAGSAKIA